MNINLVSLFPEYFDGPLSSALMGRAVDKGLVSFNRVDPRDFTEDRHRTVDDRPYGGGPGMVMMLDPLVKALNSLERPGRILLMSPSGRSFTQADAKALAGEENVTIICGRYEGIDARLEQLFPIEPVSVGDFVLCGGEAGAACVAEAVCRLLPGFMGHEHSGEEESFSHGLLEYPHYTRPEEYEGLRAPQILLSGDHGRIAAWRREQSLRVTLKHRPELLDDAPLDKKDMQFLQEEGVASRQDGPNRNLYVVLVHYPVVNKKKKIVTVSLTNLDIHDIARCSRSGGLGGYYIATPLEDQQRLARELVGHWLEGPGRAANPDRREAMQTVAVVDGLEEAVLDIVQQTGQTPTVIATSARDHGTETVNSVREKLRNGPVLLVFGTGSGLAWPVLKQADAVLRPIRPYNAYNHYSVRSAAAIILDRILGDGL